MIYLIDASVYVFRAYYSMPPVIRDRAGRPTHAVYGFTRFLCELIEQSAPRYLAVAFDASLNTSFRNQIYPLYKANREPAPPDLEAQFGRCREVCEHLGLRHFSSADYEADDIIGTLAARGRAAGLRATLVTRDKDLAQLVHEGDVYWDFGGKQRFYYHDIAARFGVVPERYADYLALTGDSVDNVPGVPGIGPKTAAALLEAFVSLEEIYDNLDVLAGLEVRGARTLAARLEQHRDAAYLARRLTAINCDMPLELDSHEALRLRPPDPSALAACFDALGFGATLRRQALRLWPTAA